MANATRDPRTGRYLNQGGFEPPPPGAPHETSQPLSPPTEADIDAARARATRRAEERAEGGGAVARPDPPAEGDGLPGMAEGHTRGSRPGALPVRPPPTILGQPSPSVSPGETGSPLDDLTESFKATHPAASNTDSPTRGVPTPSADPGKQITGGWGPVGSGSEYFALNGAELKAIVVALADRLKQALDGDLRFGLSVVYPQVKVSLSLTVDGRSPEGRDLDLKDEARLHLQWDRILTLDADVEDSEQTPAGKIRDDFQLKGPTKQVVRAGAARMLVDVPHDRT